MVCCFVATWTKKEHLLPDGKESARLTCPFLCLIPFMGSGFFWTACQFLPLSPFSIFQGREYTKDLAWAGFCIQPGPADTIQNLPKIMYRIGFS